MATTVIKNIGAVEHPVLATGTTAVSWEAILAGAAALSLILFIARRLRTQWMGIHIDEAYFRDTAQGFLAWAVATLATAALLTSTIGVIVSSGASVAGGVASAAIRGAAAIAPIRGSYSYHHPDRFVFTWGLKALARKFKGID